MNNNKTILIGGGVLVALVLLCGGMVTGAAFMGLLSRGGSGVAKGPTVRIGTPLSPTTKAMPPVSIKMPVPPTVAVPPRYARDKVPSAEDLRKLTTETLMDIHQAVKAKDVKLLQSKMAKIRQGEFGLDNLKKFLDFLVNSNVDFSGVKDAVPTFDPPAQVMDGKLTVQGSYPSKPTRVKFTFEYVFEDDTWKLSNPASMSTESGN